MIVSMATMASGQFPQDQKKNAPVPSWPPERVVIRLASETVFLADQSLIKFVKCFALNLTDTFTGQAE